MVQAMAEMAHITDVVERGLARLPSHLDGAPNVRGITTAALELRQLLSDAQWDTYTAVLDADDADGEQLDLFWARRLGVARAGLSDAELRYHLDTWDLVYASSGELTRMRTIALRVSGGVDGRAWTVGGGEYAIEVIVAEADWPLSEPMCRRLGATIDAATAAGVMARPLVVAPERYFGWQGDPRATGWGDAPWAEAL